MAKDASTCEYHKDRGQKWCDCDQPDKRRIAELVKQLRDLKTERDTLLALNSDLQVKIIYLHSCEKLLSNFDPDYPSKLEQMVPVSDEEAQQQEQPENGQN